MAKKGGLGKGLEALLTTSPQKDALRVESLPLDEIKPNPAQPRKDFDEDRLLALTQSIEDHGVLQPIVVRRVAGGYEIVAGERRYRASRQAGLKEIPAIVRDLEEITQAKLAMVENLQREDLNIVEEAQGYEALLEEYGLTQQELSDQVGKSRVHISNSIRLLGLSPSILNQLEKGELSAGHGRALLMFPEERREKIAELAIKEGLSVRALESMSKRTRPVDGIPNPPKDPHVVDMEKRLSEALGTKVAISMGKRASKLEITVYSREDLEGILDKLL